MTKTERARGTRLYLLGAISKSPRFVAATDGLTRECETEPPILGTELLAAAGTQLTNAVANLPPPNPSGLAGRRENLKPELPAAANALGALPPRSRSRSRSRRPSSASRVASSELPPELAASRNLRRNLRRRRNRRRSESAAPKGPSLFSRAGAGESFARILRSVPCRGPAQKELYVRATQ